MENGGKTDVTGSDGGGMKDLGDMLENVEQQVREGRNAARAGDVRDFEDRVERAQDELARVRLAYRRWLAVRGASSVADHRMSV